MDFIANGEIDPRLRPLLFRIEDVRWSDFFLPERLRNLFQERGIELGRGGVGVVYPLEDWPVVVKLIRPCQGNHVATRLECARLHDPNPIIQVPHGQRSLLSVPNLLLEGLIGMYLTILVENGYSPHFARYYGVYVSPATLTSYLLIERLQSQIETQLQTKADVYAMLFQVCQGLAVGQAVFGLTHYDTHGDNILYRSIDPRTVHRYLLSNGRHFYLTGSNFSAKISDFGHSRMETRKAVLSPATSQVPFRSWGLFNAHYDLMLLVGSMLNDRPSTPLQERVRSLLSLEDQAELLSVLFQRPIGRVESLEDWIRSIQQEYYVTNARGQTNRRPKYPNNILYADSLDPAAMMNWLADKLVELGYGSYTPPPRPIPILVRPVRYYRDQPRIASQPPDVSHIVEGLSVVSWQERIRYPPPEYAHTFTSSQLADCPYQDQYIHVAFADTAKLRAQGFQLKLDCCKFNLFDYMSDRVGLAVNGGFFRIKSDFLPIGPYRDADGPTTMTEQRDRRLAQRRGGSTDMVESPTPPTGSAGADDDQAWDQALTQAWDQAWETNTPIPEAYRQLYRALIINDGQAQIVPLYEEQQEPGRIQISEQLVTADYILASGPILIDGSMMLTPETMEATGTVDGVDDVKLFQCRSPTADDQPNMVLEPPYRKTVYRTTHRPEGGRGISCRAEVVPGTDRTVNCERIQPGILAHGGNPNPRTMVLLRDNSDGLGDLAFVMVEGRDQRGVGMDLFQLAQLARRLGARQALNLDGGRTSNMVWRRPDDPALYTVSPESRNSYPVGNILALTRS